MTDAQVATDMNLARIPRAAEPVQRWKIKSYLAQAGKLIGILTDNVHASAALFRVWYSDPDLITIDTTDLGFQGAMQALKADGLVSQGDIDAVNALGVTYVSRAQSLTGWGVPVQEPDVFWVRNH